MKKESLSRVVSICLCVSLMMPAVNTNANEIVDSEFSDEVIEYYEESPAYNEVGQISDAFDAGQATDDIGMSDSSISDEITEYYEETDVVGEYSDPVNETV